MNSSNSLAVAALAALALAGCTANDTTMGGAFKHNVAMQTINPDPEYDGELVEGGDGVRSAAAIDRYQKGQVKQPATMTTTTRVSGGSGSGSGSGGGPN